MAKSVKRDRRVSRVRRTVKGGMGWRHDRMNINNHPIPTDLAIKKFIINILFGMKGKIISLPHPGEIFFSGADNSLENGYVCVQSCISSLKTPIEFNAKQHIISAPQDRSEQDEQDGEDGEDGEDSSTCNDALGNKPLDLSLIDLVLRSDKKVLEFYKAIRKMNADKKINVNTNSKLAKVIDAIQALADKMFGEIHRLDANSGAYAKECVIYGVPLVKYTRGMANKGTLKDNGEEITDQDVKDSNVIRGFSLGDLQLQMRNVLTQNTLVDKLKYMFNATQEDLLNKRFGVLDLIDSNELSYSEAYGTIIDNAKRDVHKVRRGVKGDDLTPGDETPMLNEETHDLERDPEKIDTGEIDTEEIDTGEIKKGEIEDIENDEKKDSETTELIAKIISAYNEYAEPGRNVNQTVATQAQEIVTKVFDEDTLEIDKVYATTKPIDNFIVVNLSNSALRFAHKPMGNFNLYRLKSKGEYGSFVFNRTDKQVKKSFTANGTRVSKIAIDMYPSDKKKLMRICKTINEEDYWVSVYSDDKKGDSIRVSLDDSSEGSSPSASSRLNTRTRRKHLRKRHGGGKWTDKLKKTLSKAASRTLTKLSQVKKRTLKFASSAVTGKSMSKLAAWFREAIGSRMVDEAMSRKNWNSRVGDTFLWLGNEYLYKKWSGSDSMDLKETFDESRSKTALDSNTEGRLPEYMSYCTIIGYGTDVLYKSRSADSGGMTETISKYGNIYKHNNLIWGGADGADEPVDKVLIYDRISSRLIPVDSEISKTNKDDEENEENEENE